MTTAPRYSAAHKGCCNTLIDYITPMIDTSLHQLWLLVNPRVIRGFHSFLFAREIRYPQKSSTFIQPKAIFRPF